MKKLNLYKTEEIRFFFTMKKKSSFFEIKCFFKKLILKWKQIYIKTTPIF